MARPDYPRFPTRPTRTRIDELFALQRAADPFGHRLHVITAGLACFLAAFPTTIVEWAAAPLLLCFLVRMWTHHRVIGPLAWDAVTRLAVAFSAWLLISAAWSAGGRAWIDDAHNLRFIILIPLLYPVLDRAGVLIACLLLGFVCGQASQLAHLAGVVAEIPRLDFQRDPSRISGWWDPVIGGSLLTAALGVCCGIVLPTDNRPRRRGLVHTPAFAFILILLILLSILLTGTRGAWIASGALGLIVLAMTLARLIARARRGRSRLPLLGFCAAVAAAAGILVAVYSGSPPLRSRVDRGIDEVRAALSGRDYTSDTGQRIAMAIWATREFRAHPLFGVGAGGFKAAAATMRQSDRRAGSPTLPLPHAHAHAWPLHTLATLGIIGFTLLAAMLIIAMRSAAEPVALGLAGLTLAGMFDTIHVNLQTAYLLFLLLALAVRVRPTPFEPPPPERLRREFRRPDSGPAA